MVATRSLTSIASCLVPKRKIQNEKVSLRSVAYLLFVLIFRGASVIATILNFGASQ